MTKTHVGTALQEVTCCAVFLCEQVHYPTYCSRGSGSWCGVNSLFCFSCSNWRGFWILLKQGAPNLSNVVMAGTTGAAAQVGEWTEFMGRATAMRHVKLLVIAVTITFAPVQVKGNSATLGAPQSAHRVRLVILYLKAVNVSWLRFRQGSDVDSLAY